MYRSVGCLIIFFSTNRLENLCHFGIFLSQNSAFTVLQYAILRCCITVQFCGKILSYILKNWKFEFRLNQTFLQFFSRLKQCCCLYVFSHFCECN